MRILVFDSGVGGLGVAQLLPSMIPHAAVTYLMDDAGFPYGDKADTDLIDRIQAVIEAGIDRTAPDIVVIACNTASTVALASLRSAFAVPFVGCVPPVKWAAQLTRSGVIGVLATPATVRGAYLHDLAARFAPNCQTLVHGASRLAGLAEQRFTGFQVKPRDVMAEIEGLVGQPGGQDIDVIALGCTHYAWLQPELRETMKPHVQWLDPAPPVARQVVRIAQEICPSTGGEPLNGLVLRTGTGNLSQGWADMGFTRQEAVAYTNPHRV